MDFNDSYRHKGLRRQLIDEIRAKGINDEKVLQAMTTLPRHYFLDKAFEEWAYMDKAFPIGSEQTISQPYTVAYMSSLLEVQKGDRILEIGTGSGYQAAILSLMGARVYSIERQEDLHKKAKKLLQELRINNVRCFFKDGTEGLSEFAPFDKIIVTAGTPSVPDALKQQLTVGGFMVVPVGKEAGQTMQKIIRQSDTQFSIIEMDAFRFVPFLSGVKKGG